MSGFLIFTCPHCRAIVDYSCLCDVPPDISAYTGHATVADAKAHVREMASPDWDGRPRGDWHPTPWILRVLGWPNEQRSIYAHGMIGSGWDGWEYRTTTKQGVE